MTTVDPRESARIVGDKKEKAGQTSTPPKPPPDSKPKTDTLTESLKITPAASSTKPATSSKLPKGVTIRKQNNTWLADLPAKQPTEDERRLMLFKNYLDAHWGLPAVVVLFRTLFAGGYPPIPIPTRWLIPKDIDLIQLIWEQIQTDNFIDEIWPSIKMLLGDDICNYEWSARVATVLSLFNIIKVLPIVLENNGEN